MGIAHLRFEPSLRRSAVRPPLDFNLLDEANDLANADKPLDSLRMVLRHLFPGREIPDLVTTPFSFTHGVCRVQVRLQNEEILIDVPMVKLPSGGAAIASLRFALTKISGSGQPTSRACATATCISSTAIVWNLPTRRSFKKPSSRCPRGPTPR